MDVKVSSPRERVAQYIEWAKSRTPTWFSGIAPDLDLLSATVDVDDDDDDAGIASRVVFSFSVRPHHSNGTDNMHGGCIASLFDWTTSLALAPVCRPGYWSLLGVTRTLNVVYLRPVPVGADLLVESVLVHAGKTMALMRAVLRRKSDRIVLATCEHNKVNTDPPSDPDSKL